MVDTNREYNIKSQVERQRHVEARSISLVHISLLSMYNVCVLLLTKSHCFLHGYCELLLQCLQRLVWRQIDTVETDMTIRLA